MAKEKVIATCRLHWLVFIPQVFLTTALLFASIAAFMENVTIGFIVLVLTAVSALSIFVRYKFNYISLTDTKVFGRVGFIKSKTLSSPISKIQNIGLRNGLGGKIFGYHTITIDNGGSGLVEFEFHCMSHAKEFVEIVEERINEYNRVQP